MRVSSGVDKLLPFDYLKINKFGAIHMNSRSDAHEYSPECQLLPLFPRNFGGGYQFFIEFACPLINLKCICHKDVQL